MKDKIERKKIRMEKARIRSNLYYKTNKLKINQKIKEQYKMNPEPKKEYMKRYYQKNKEKASRTNHQYWIKNKETLSIKNMERYYKNRKAHLEQKKEYHRRTYPLIRLEVITYYGNGKAACVCCGENNLDFLTIDHINNDRYMYKHSGEHNNLILKLKRINFPKGFQTLCWNCNMGKAKRGTCPHQTVKTKLPIKITWSKEVM
jgi:hypothetical protein